MVVEGIGVQHYGSVAVTKFGEASPGRKRLRIFSGARSNTDCTPANNTQTFISTCWWPRYRPRATLLSRILHAPAIQGSPLREGNRPPQKKPPSARPSLAFTRGDLPRHQGVALLPIPPPKEMVYQRRINIPRPHCRLQFSIGQQLLTHGRHPVGVVLC